MAPELLLDVKLLRLLDQLHRTRSVTRAAKALGQSQPTVSIWRVTGAGLHGAVHDASERFGRMHLDPLDVIPGSTRDPWIAGAETRTCSGTATTRHGSYALAFEHMNRSSPKPTAMIAKANPVR